MKPVKYYIDYIIFQITHFFNIECVIARLSSHCYVTAHTPTNAQPTKCAKFQLVHRFHAIYSSLYHIYGVLPEILHKNRLLHYIFRNYLKFCTKGANSDSRNSDLNTIGGQRPPLCSRDYMWQTKRPHATFKQPFHYN
jgi:hypothetical protein